MVAVGRLKGVAFELRAFARDAPAAACDHVEASPALL